MEAAFFRSQLRLLLRGEPLTRVAARMDGREYELADLPEDCHGKIELYVVRNRMTLPASMLMVRSAQASVRNGQVLEGFEWLCRAAAADPHDPEPHAVRGSWLLAGGDVAAAAEAFGEAERLAPGWPRCRTGLWLARKLLLGELEADAVEVWFGPDEEDPEQRLETFRELTRRHDRLALPWLNVAAQLQEMGRTAEAGQACAEGLLREGDDATRTCLLLGAANEADDPAERRWLTEQAVALGGDLVAVTAADMMLRKR